MEIMPPDTGNKDPQTGTLIRLRGLYPSLKTALRKVADVILRQPEMAIYASVNEVAAVATVSEATVMRFCRILGFKGFQDFKIALAREMVIPSPRFHEEVGGEGEDDTAVVRKVFQTNTVALQDTLEILEIEAMKEAAQLLLTARQILVVGVGGSGPAVTYTGNRFLLLGLKATTVHRLLPDADGGLPAVPGRRGAGHLQLGNHPGNRGNGGDSPGKTGQGHVYHQQFPFTSGPGLQPGPGYGFPGGHPA